jgi:hypothetical protein
MYEIQDPVCANDVLQWSLFSSSIILFLSTIAIIYWTITKLNLRNRRNITIKVFIQSNIVLLSILTAISRLCISSTTRFIFSVLASLVRTQAVLLTEILWLDISKTLKTSVQMLQYVDRRDVNITILIFGTFMLIDWIVVVLLMILVLKTQKSDIVLGLNIFGLVIASFVICSSIVLWLKIYKSVSKMRKAVCDNYVTTSNTSDNYLTTTINKLVVFSKKSTIVYATFTSLLSANIVFTIILLSTDSIWPVYTNDIVSFGITVCILAFTLI